MISMSNVWDRATEFVGDNLGALARIAIIILIFAAVQDLLTQATQDAPQATKLAIQCVVLLVAIISLFARLGILAMAIDDRRSPGEALALAAGRLLAVIGVLIVLGLIFAPLPLALAFTISVPAASVPVLSHYLGPIPDWALAIFAIGVFAALVGLALLAARLSLVLPIVVQERVGLVAFARSWRRTHGMTLRILGVLILLVTVGGVAALAAKAVFGSVLRLALGDAGPWSASAIITAIIVALVATVFSVVGDAFTGKLYLATLAREQGDDGTAEATTA